MLDVDRIMKLASKYVDASLKKATMIKEIPGEMHRLTSIPEELDPEILEVIEALLGKTEKTAATSMMKGLINKANGIKGPSFTMGPSSNPYDFKINPNQSIPNSIAKQTYRNTKGINLYQDWLKQKGMTHSEDNLKTWKKEVYDPARNSGRPVGLRQSMEELVYGAKSQPQAPIVDNGIAKVNSGLVRPISSVETEAQKEYNKLTNKPFKELTKKELTDLKEHQLALKSNLLARRNAKQIADLNKIRTKKGKTRYNSTGINWNGNAYINSEGAFSGEKHTKPNSEYTIPTLDPNSQGVQNYIPKASVSPEQIITNKQIKQQNVAANQAREQEAANIRRQIRQIEQARWDASLLGKANKGFKALGGLKGIVSGLGSFALPAAFMFGPQLAQYFSNSSIGSLEN